MKRRKAIEWVLLFGVWTMAGCTFSVASGDAAGKASAGAATEGSASGGNAVVKITDPKTGIIQEAIAGGGGTESKAVAEAMAKMEASANASNKNLSALFGISIIAGAFLAILGIAEVVKFFARIKAGTGL